MATVELKVNVPLDNVVIMGKMVIDSLTEDVAVFSISFKTIDDTYVTTLNSKLAAVTGLIYPSQLLGKQAKLTNDINAQIDLLPSLLNITEGQINDAKANLKTLPKYFGISKIRNAKYKRDIAGIVDGLNSFIQSISDKDNFPLLEAKGLTTAQVATYKGIHTSLTTLFQDRIDIDKARKELVDNNYTVINDFWAEIRNVCDKGKRVFKSTNPTKVANYTLTKLNAKLNHDLKLNNIHGKVTANDVAVNKVFIELTPLDTGRRRTAKSKNGGLYEIGGIVPGKYALSASLNGFKLYNTEVEIKQGEKLNFDIQLEVA